jgi:xanthine dehydrogenase accessory factor
LRSERVPFVEATVVRVERPTSAKPGDTALVLADGTIVGFVGGECAEASVAVQALFALEQDEAVLLRITPDGPASLVRDPTGTVTVHNPCLSGGALEIFLEPTLPPPLVVILGDAPIARAVADLAERLGYAVVGADAGPIPADAMAVVAASHGRGEAEVLTAAARAQVPYIGLVASPRRGAGVLAALDLTPEERACIRTPAGLDIGARTPEEVALSILAEIVSRRPRVSSLAAPAPAQSSGPSPTAVDPICGMTVVAAASTLQVDRDGVRYWFCGSGCRQAFIAPAP